MTYSLEDLPIIAQKLIDLAKNKKIWIFEGEMGMGKTTLIRAICKELGVKGNIQSPTFSIVNEYLSSNNEIIYHFDFYRIKNPNEALDFGIEEYFDSGNKCFLEWAEKIEFLLPDNCFKIIITQIDDKTRKILVEKQ